MKFPLIAAAALMAASVSAQAVQINYSLDSVAGATIIGFDSFDGLVNTTGTIDLGNTTDIKSLRITGVGAVADNVTTAVPEPSTYALTMVALGILLGSRKLRSRQD